MAAKMLQFLLLLLCVPPLCLRPTVYEVLYQGEIAVIDNQNLHQIPTSLEPNFTSLLVKNNYIFEVGKHDLQNYPKLQNLNLANNSIQSSGSLTGLKAVKKLEGLDLSRNRIGTFNFKDLRSSSALQTINLSHNLKINIAKDVQRLPHLYKLLLRSCNLDDNIPWEVFMAFPNLKILELRDNKITTIPQEVFDRFQSNSVELLSDSSVTVQLDDVDGKKTNVVPDANYVSSSPIIPKNNEESAANEADSNDNKSNGSNLTPSIPKYCFLIILIMVLILQL